jgi:hypothetical protein
VHQATAGWGRPTTGNDGQAAPGNAAVIQCQHHRGLGHCTTAQRRGVGWLSRNSEAIRVRILVKMVGLKDGDWWGGITGVGGKTEIRQL